MQNFLQIAAISLVLALGGCTTPNTHKTAPIASPSTGRVKTSITEAQNSVKRAKDSTIKLDSNINKSKDIADRIDHKAIIILENWK